MPRNYSIKETIKRVKEKELTQESLEATVNNNTVANNPTTEKIVDIEIPIQEEVKTEEYIERFDKEEISKKKDTIIQSIAKKLKWWS